MSTPLKVLIVEDSVDDTFFVVRELQRDGFNVAFERVETLAQMQAALAASPWDLIISDYSLPRFSGPDALALFRQQALEIPFIMVSGIMGEERAVEILKKGAHDYVMKGNLARLGPAIRRELASAQERRFHQQRDSNAAFLISLVESCADAIIGTNPDGLILSWNSGAENLYGYDSKEAIGHPICLLDPPTTPAATAHACALAAQGKPLQAFEATHLRKAGTSLRVSLTISPVRDLSGRVIGVSLVARPCF